MLCGAVHLSSSIRKCCVMLWGQSAQASVKSLLLVYPARSPWPYGKEDGKVWAPNHLVINMPPQITLQEEI